MGPAALSSIHGKRYARLGPAKILRDCWNTGIVTRPWLSIVTVVMDDDEGFDSTLQSIDSQDLSGTELIVIDSSVNASRITSALADRSQPTTYVWMPPQGIYAAMNHGVEHAQGDFVYFANAGDEFFTSQVLAEVKPYLDEIEWACGRIEVVHTGGERVISPSWDFAREKRRRFSGGYFPPHQGTFVRRECMHEHGGFDTSYTIAADYALALKLSMKTDPRMLPMVVASFVEGGSSTVKWSQAVREFHRARMEVFQPRGASHISEIFATARQWILSFGQRVVRPKVTRIGS